MALLSFLVGRPTRVRFRDENVTPPRGEQDLLLVDATMSDEITREAEVTDHPVEDGIDVTDHIRPLPVKYRIEGYVSETPITFFDDLPSLVTAGASVLTQPLGGFASGLATVAGSQVGASLLKGGQNPAETARKALEDMLTNKRIFTIITKTGRLENMVLVSLTFPRDNATGRGLQFTAQCKQIRIVKAASVLIPKLKKDAAHSAAKKSNLGTQPTGDATDANQKKSSILYKLLKGS